MPYSYSGVKNRLLETLDADAMSRLLPYLESVELTRGDVLYDAGDRMTHVHFPVDSLVSIRHVLEDGASAEIAMIGNDGVVGTGIFMGADISHNRVLVQAGGKAYRLPSGFLKKEFNRHEQLHDLLLAYTQALLTQMAQTAVCNRHHNVDQQLCRWLLLSLDRLPAEALAMTQEQIASMLGVRREGVSEAAGKLQKLGVIRYSRGNIELLDRTRLEALSCECYSVVKRALPSFA